MIQSIQIMGKALERAVDPRQYYYPETGWPYDEIGFGPALCSLFWEYISTKPADWKGKDILDIGAGTCWMLGLMHQFGARYSVGVEPSPKKVELARQYFPDVEAVCTTFENFQTERRFDIAFSIMSMSHMRHLESAFIKISSLLKTNGEFQTIVPDYDYFKKKQSGNKTRIEELSEAEFAISIERPDLGVSADIVRKVSRFQEAGEKAGLTLVDDKPIIPTEKFTRRRLHYREAEGVTIWHLLKFTKTI